MKDVYTWAAKPAKRTITVGDLIKYKGQKKFTQVTANTTLEAHAAEEAGFDMIIGSASNVKQVREGLLGLMMPKDIRLTDDKCCKGKCKPKRARNTKGKYKAAELSTY